MKYLVYPKDIPELHNQKEQWDVTDEFNKAIRKKSEFVLTHQIVQFLFFFLFLGPLKLIFSLIIGIFLFIWIRILLLFIIFFKNQINFQKWCFSLIHPFYRAFLFTLGFIKIEKDRDFDPDSRIFISNYTSFIDPFFYFSLFPFTYIKYNEKIRIFNTFFADIFDYRTIKSSTDEIISHISKDPFYLPMLIFPEKRPGNGTAIVKFAKDAFSTEYVVQPCTIRYYLAYTPETFNSLYNDGNNLIKLYFNILCIPFIKVRISYLEPFARKDESIPSSDIAQQIQLRIASELGVLAINNKFISKEKED